jgi:curved DNA-binding protein CbpA
MQALSWSRLSRRSSLASVYSAAFVGKRHASSDLYGILGVPRTASASEIKKAYYDRSKELHPDRNLGDDDSHRRFAKVNEAYSVLSNVRRISQQKKKVKKRERERILSQLPFC